MTPSLIAIYIAIGFLSGFLVTSLICLNIHDRHKKAWMVEYRRLMSGISKARNDVIDLNIHRVKVSVDLDRLYCDDPEWPRE